MRSSLAIISLSMVGSAMSQAACTTICTPIMKLMSACGVNGATTSTAAIPTANMKCVCTNVSFDVTTLGGLCMSCLMQNKKENKPLMQLATSCQFEAVSYQPSLDSLANGVTVQASAPPGGMAAPTGSTGTTPTGSMAASTGRMGTPTGSMGGMNMSKGSHAYGQGGFLLEAGFAACLALGVAYILV